MIMDLMQDLRRTCYCGEVTKAGETVVVGGFVQKVRNLGNLIFIDLRDRTGIVQLAFNDQTDRAIFEKAASCHSEYVLLAKGVVAERSSINKDMKTGAVEVLVDDLRVLSKAQTPPFAITDETKTNEELRLKYRYLDLRRAPLQHNLMMRHKIALAAREYFYANNFIEIETPMMMKSTPEGARDYLIPSRVHNGKFYALPQSPQIYKQLLMVAGMDRYIQIARCFRDEDLRADRQPEFTQIDLEMSFVDVEDILQLTEGFVKYLFQKVLHMDITTPLPRMTYQEAMERYGSDKPDTRFGMEIQDVSEVVAGCGFRVFEEALAAGNTICAICAGGAGHLSRKELDALGEFVKTYHVKGLAWAVVNEDGTLRSSFAKAMQGDSMQRLLETLSAKPGDAVFVIADKKYVALTAMGQLRLRLGKQLNLIDSKRYDLLWVTEFPLLEWSDEENRFLAMHHPFTNVMEEDIPLMDTDPGAVRAKAYDLVMNGVEMGSGSIRIHQSDVQEKMFKLLGFTKEQAWDQFGFLLGAFQYGTPPHGGFAFGIDRMVMILSGAESLRDVLAFPKIQNGACLMMETPSAVQPEQLEQLKIRCVE